MAEIRPFRGVRYNEALIGDLAEVICPPYDIITPDMAHDLYQRSEYNFVRLEYGRQLPLGEGIEDRFAHSAATLEQWLKRGILKTDREPAIYLHDHHFTYQGKDYRRRGIMVAVRLVDWDEMVVRPHEGTLAKPKNDRLNLLWALGANTSPVLAIFDDQEREIASLLNHETQNRPIISVGSATKDRHNIWAVSDSEIIERIKVGLASKPLYIADGHHRYESALAFQRERRACSKSVSGEEGFNFVMMTLVDMADPGLIVLSPHRLVRGISRTTLNELGARLESFFEVEKLPLNMPGVWQQVDTLLAGEKSNRVTLVLFGLSLDYFVVLKLKDLNAASRMMPYFHSELYSRLGVSILDHIILERMLGLGSGSEEIYLTFSYDKHDAVEKVLEQEYQLAFLLSPVKVEQIRAVADIGERMPRKSTYFYPKPPAGLIFRRLE